MTRPGEGNTPIQCDKCHEMFKMKDVLVETEKLSAQKDVEMTYFHCPCCGAEFIVSVTDSDQRERFEKVKKMWYQYGLKFADGSSERSQKSFLKKILEFQSEINAWSKHLKKVWTNAE